MSGILSPLRIAFSIIFSFLFLWGVQAQSGVPNSAQDICPLLPGEQVPELSLVGIDGEAFQLSDQPAVMIFYRGGW